MPLYDYACNECGPFRGWQSMSAAAAPADCPDCGEPARRMITAPFLADMNAYNRVAHQRNEKSADQPRVVNKTQGNDAGVHPHRRPSHAGHGHSHGHGRPWMIGH